MSFDAVRSRRPASAWLGVLSVVALTIVVACTSQVASSSSPTAAAGASAAASAPAGASTSAAPASAGPAGSSSQPGPGSTAGTGVHGIVEAGPTCPVQRPDDSGCAGRRIAGATLVALDAAGKEVARGVSDASGAYWIPLAPGTYTIEPRAVSGLMGTARPATVTVTDGPPATLDFAYDTGIR